MKMKLYDFFVVETIERIPCQGCCIIKCKSEQVTLNYKHN